MHKLTMQDIRELREAAEKATTRPWHTGGDFFDMNGRVRKWLWGPRAKPGDSSGPCVVGESDPTEDDAEFIALAANRATAMADAIEALARVARAAKLFRSNAPGHILVCAREQWGITNVNCAIRTGAELDETLNYFQAGEFAGLLEDEPEISSGEGSKG